MYKPQEEEKKILKFWGQKKIFAKLRKKNKGKKRFSFLDGPITANNPMGVHHAEGRTYKDLFQRFKAMQGYDQRFQNGFDCQGLWIEREEEKDLGLKNKKDIEKFGILNFVKACRKRVEKFSKIQRDQSIRLGYWMDWDNSYYTMSESNNLHNWFLMKKYHEKGLLYKGKDVVPWCPRCGTASSKHDILTEGYREVTHNALFMQFPIKEKSNEYILIFTTTPWTVPCDIALAVNEKINYMLVENKNKKYWIAEKRLGELEGEYKILEKKKGKNLEGIKYIMPYASLDKLKEIQHKIVLWDLASEEEGTGVIHVAPGCGSEDHELGEKLGLPSVAPLDDAGNYQEGFNEFSLKNYSQVNNEVTKDLEKRGFIYKIVKYRHRYPHCHRCGNELVFRLVDEWYIKCTEEFRKKLIKENEKVKWFPEYGKTRQKYWFENMGDWLISRKRYWGLPLPFWECECKHLEVIGSLKELKEKAIDKKKVNKLPEIHRPWIDEIKLKCPKCKKEMKRVLDVGDAWLDAGIVGLSTIGPYLEKKEEWKKWYPAEFITENMPGQYRGWYNALFWASVFLTGEVCFKSLLGYESVKDEKGEEMHKSKGNAIWFDDAVEKVGADPMRMLYCLQDPTQELKFGYNALKIPVNNLNILFNLSKLIENSKKVPISKIEDRWILSKLNSLIKKVTEELDEMHFHLAMRALKDFWLNDLSRGYVQFIRDRLSNEDKEAKYVLKEVYIELLKLCSPFVPFITEKTWQLLREKKIAMEESVHLCNWPKLNKKKINKSLEEEMELAFKIIEIGLAQRDKNQIGLKWPLPFANISYYKAITPEVGKIIKEQLNVKEIEILTGNKEEISVELDFNMNAELEAEGYAREISRQIQAFRKNLGLKKENKIELILIVDDEFKKILENQKNSIQERTNSKKFFIVTREKEKFKNKIDFEIKDKRGKIVIITTD